MRELIDECDGLGRDDRNRHTTGRGNVDRCANPLSPGVALARWRRGDALPQKPDPGLPAALGGWGIEVDEAIAIEDSSTGSRSPRRHRDAPVTCRSTSATHALAECDTRFAGTFALVGRVRARACAAHCAEWLAFLRRRPPLYSSRATKMCQEANALAGRTGELERRGSRGVMKPGRVRPSAPVIAVIAAWLFGVDPRMIMGFRGRDTMTGSPTQGPAPRRPTTGRFVSVVLASTEEVWSKIFNRRQDLPAPEAGLQWLIDIAQTGAAASGFMLITEACLS